MRSAKRLDVDPHALALAVPFKRLPGSSAPLPLGCLVGRASPSGGLMPALESCQGWPAMVVVVACGEGSVVPAARVADDAPGSTIQRASAWDPMAGLGGTSSSGATGTSGGAGVTFAVTTGCGFPTAVAGSLVSTVATGRDGPVIERVTPIANNNTNATNIMFCFMAASPRIEQKGRPCPPSRGSTTLHSFKINSGWLEAD